MSIRPALLSASVLELPDAGIGDVSVESLAEARDDALIRGIADGNEESFRQLYRRYAAAAYGLALRIARQQFLAQEVVQETFLALWRGAAAYDASRGTVRTWLLSTVHHRAVDGVRREESQVRRAEHASRQLDPDIEVADDVAEAIDLDADREHVRKALRRLPPVQREVLELMYFGGMTQAAVAEHLSLPLGTVKSRCLLAMRKLRAALVRRYER